MVCDSMSSYVICLFYYFHLRVCFAMPRINQKSRLIQIVSTLKIDVMNNSEIYTYSNIFYLETRCHEKFRYLDLFRYFYLGIYIFYQERHAIPRSVIILFTFLYYHFHLRFCLVILLLI